MKKGFFTLFFLAVLTCFGFSQDHIITLQGIAFSPNELTINVGETVQWDNQMGTHNVNGSAQSYPDNPEGFSSGAAAPAPWQFEHTFTIPGTYNYHCDPHFSFGMTGVITVTGAGSGDVVISEINYNNPGTDSLEFVELYNNGSTAVELEGWVLSDAIDFTFPQHTLMPGEFVVVAGDAFSFEAAFGFLPFEFTGALNNSGEPIMLSDASGALVDEVAYDDVSPWPTDADGFGPSLVLCDYDSDNSNGANWGAAATSTGVFSGGTEILANPNGDSECLEGPIIGFLNNGFSVLEDAGSVFAQITMSNGDANTTTVDVEMNMASTAANGDDFILTLPTTVTFDAGVAFDTQTVVINLVNDMDIEPNEVLLLDLTNPTNDGNISPNGAQFNLNILDDDTPLTEALVITGVFDTQPAGAGVKGVELKAIEDIPSLNIFGVGSANNGGGSSGVETSLPDISVSAGDCIYVVDDSLAFIDFFGFSPTIVGAAANINGDDAIELFENNIVIDVFGDIFVDGTGEPWEYLDGWAYRNSGTGPDGPTFVLDNWSFSGIDAFDNVPNNAAAPIPFPTCTYSVVPPTTAIANDDNVTVPFEAALTINVLGNDVTPNALTSMEVTSGPSNGSVTVNGTDDITYTPDDDYCGPDQFTYEICDAEGCDDAVVNITVECPTVYPAYDIASVTSVNADGQPDSLDIICQVQGVVHGINYQASDSRLEFALIDGTGGITVFEFNDFGYAVTEGDELIVQGYIDAFNCLTEMRVDTLWVVSTGNPLVTPAVTTFLNEDFEAELVELTNLTFVDPADWLGDGTSFDVRVTNGTFENIMRIDNDCELSSMPIPVQPFIARGIGTQYNDQGDCTSGYQFLPRYAADIIPASSAEESLLAQNISFYPNPVGEELFLKTELNIEAIHVSNLLGQQLMYIENPDNALNVSDLDSGVYLLTFQVEDSSWTAKFVKK